MKTTANNTESKKMTLDEEMAMWEARANDEFGKTLKEINEKAFNEWFNEDDENGVSSTPISHHITAYALDGNRKHLAAMVAEHLPKAVLTPLEATYLGWIDLRAYGFNGEALMQRTIAAGVQFTGGTFFGDNGDGFLRINIGCPRRYITEGILRLKKALEA